MKQTFKLLAISLLAASALTFARSPSARAASLTVDTDLHPSACSLNEAIVNINNQAQTNMDCLAGDGNSDTISIPAGTIVLNADLPQIIRPVSVRGAGMGLTTINGGGQYRSFYRVAVDGDFALSDLRITAIYDAVVFITESDVATIERVELDGAGSDTNLGGLMGAVNEALTPMSLVISDVYMHDFTVDSGGLLILPITTSTTATVHAEIKNTTISRISNTGIINGILSGTGFAGSQTVTTPISANLSNITITDITSDSAVNAAGVIVIHDQPTTTSSSMNITNSTFIRMSGVVSPYGGPTTLVAAGGALDAAGVASTILTLKNVLVSNSGQDNPALNCGMANISSGFGGLGAANNSIVSLGGNISDDISCTPFFTQISDQNSVGGLASTLEALADNGGHVPTVALKQGSPAVDSGVAVAGLTQDARLAIRPQGAAYDSGAYESPFTKPAKATLASTGESIKLFTVGALLLMSPMLIFAISRLSSQSTK